MKIKRLVRAPGFIAALCGFIIGFGFLFNSKEVARAITCPSGYTTATGSVLGRQTVIKLTDTYGCGQQALVWVPDTYTTDPASTVYPLLIALGGTGQNGSTDITKISNGGGQISNRISEGWNPIATVNGTTYKFIVVSPQWGYAGGEWGGSGNDLDDFITQIQKAYHVDASRIYLTGLSSGGNWLYGISTVPSLIQKAAAIAAVSAAGSGQGIQYLPNISAGNLPVWNAVGRASGNPYDPQNGPDTCYSAILNNSNYTSPSVCNSNYGNVGAVKGQTPPFTDPFTVIQAGTYGGKSYDGGHWATPAYNPSATFAELGNLNMYEWLLTKTRGGGTTNNYPTVSITTPSNGATFTAPATITLSANASDSDGTIKQVSFYNNGSIIGTDTSSPYSVVTPAALSAGTYTFTAQATDNQNAVTTSSIVTVTVGSAQQSYQCSDGKDNDSDGLIDYPNDPGCSSATDNDETNTVTGSSPYGGTAAAIPGTVQAERYDLGGQNVAYYDSTSGNSGGAFRSDNVDIETVLNGTVTDVGYVTNGEWMKYTVNVSTAGTYTITGNFASPNSGDQLRVEMDGTTVGTFTIPNTGGFQAYSTATITSTALTAGAHVMRLYEVTSSATDGLKGFNTDYVTFALKQTQQNAAPSVSITTPSNGATFTAPATITLSASASDSDGTISKVDFYNGSSLISTDTSTPYSATTPAALSAGTYTFTAKATDNQNAVTTSSAVTVTVGNGTPGNPTISITSPADGTKYTSPATVVVTADASETNGTIKEVDFFNTNSTGAKNLLTVVTKPPYTLTRNNVAERNYDITATAIDALGKTVTTPDLHLSVSPPANDSKPVANAGNDQTITLPTNTTTLSGSGTDTDGTITDYVWTETSGSAIQFASPHQSTTSVSGLTKGTYTFRLSVTDNKGAKAHDDVTLVVNAAVGANCSANKIYIQKAGDAGAIINGSSSYKPGDTFVLKASSGPYSYMSFLNVHGTPDCPLTITNEGGIAQVDHFSIEDSSYIHITGTGASGVAYGIEVADNKAGPTGGVGIDIGGRSSNIEVDNVNIHNKLYGFWIKQDAGCDVTEDFPKWWLDSMSIHDNKISNIGQEGMYLGTTDPNGTRAVTCNGVPLNPPTKPLRLSNIKIFNNSITHTNRAGIQLSDADLGENEVYNNTISNTGLEQNQTQGGGITLGGYTHAYVHDNNVSYSWIQNFWSLGSGLVDAENNTFDHAGVIINDNGSLTYNPLNMETVLIDTRPTNNPAPAFSDPRPLTNPVANPNPELTTIVLKNNLVGSNTSYNIRFYKTANTYAQTGNVICNNQLIAGATTKGILYSDTNTPPYSTDCGTSLIGTDLGTAVEDALDTFIPTVSTSTDTTVTTPSGDTTGAVAYVNASALNVRTSASTTASIVTKLPKNTAVTVLSTTTVNSTSWSQIQSGSTSGWVASSYLTAAKHAMVTTQQLNVRSTAGTASAAIGTVNTGDTGIVLTQNSSGTWTKITFDSGLTGWVSTKYITIQ